MLLSPASVRDDATDSFYCAADRINGLHLTFSESLYLCEGGYGVSSLVGVEFK